MNNTVIKVLNEEHGKKVIKFFKSKGIDTRNHKGTSTLENGDRYIYYGIINNIFDNFLISAVKRHNAKIITLPEDLPIPRMVLVRNYNNTCSTWYERELIEDLSRFDMNYPYICKNIDSSKHWSGWKYMKEIEEVQEMTLEEVCKELGREIKIVK